MNQFSIFKHFKFISNFKFHPDSIGTNSQNGQALLIVVLIMVVSLTVGLSVVGRSVTNLRTSVEEENSQRAFSAAEAGIEKALQSGTGVATREDLPNRSAIEQVIVQRIQGTEFLIHGGNPTAQDDGGDIWLSDYPDYLSPWSGTLTIFWGTASDTCSANAVSNTMAALEVVILTGTRMNPTATRYAFDACNLRTSLNRFTQVGVGDIGSFVVANRTFRYRATVLVTTGIIGRIIPLYANSPLAVRGTSILPAQGNRIESLGSSGGTQRRVQVYQAYPKLPSEFFQYVLFQTGS